MHIPLLLKLHLKSESSLDLSFEAVIFRSNPYIYIEGRKSDLITIQSPIQSAVALVSAGRKLSVHL